MLWAYTIGIREQNQVWKTKLNAGIKEVESEKRHGATAEDRWTESFLVGYDFMVIQRLMEIG